MRTTRGETHSLSRLGLVCVSGALHGAHPVLSALGASSVGVALLDRKLRYCAINRTLAAIHRVPRRAHLGRAIHSVIGSLADEVAPRIETVFGSGRPVVDFELSGMLPTSDQVGYWIDDYLPVFDEEGRVAYVCPVVIEVTQEKRLEQHLKECRTRTSKQLTNILRFTQGALGQCLIAATSGRLRHVDIERNLGAFRQLMLKVDEMLRRITVAELPGEGNEPKRRASVRALSVRQRTVLQFLAEGKLPKEIATLLNISAKTVDTHKARICKRLGIDSLADLTRYAIRAGLVEL